MSDRPVTVLVMDQVDGAGSELETLLGTERAGALWNELTVQAEGLAREIADAAPRRVASSEALSDEVERAFAQHPAAVLVLWPSLPRLRPEHGHAALDDLRAGCTLVFGPLMGGGLYLLGLARLLPEVLAAVNQGSEGGDVTPAVLAAARPAELEIGYLRPERSLRTADDITAALFDPLTPQTVRRILTPDGDVDSDQAVPP
jgi:hypothetical protein